MAKSAPPDHEDSRAARHTWFVPSTAKPSKVIFASDMQVASTNVKCDTGNTEDCPCDWVQLKCVNFSLVFCDVRELTSAEPAPYLIVLSTDFSIDPLITGEYAFSNPSSSWSDERRASTYEDY